DRGVDLARVSGTGPGGRITRQDVEQFISHMPSAPAEQPKPSSRAVTDRDEQVPVSRMQQTVAARLSESKVTAPHFYVTTEVDMTQAVGFRLQINEAEPSLKLSFNDLIVKACGLALQTFPGVNASWQNGSIVRHGRVSVGIAVDLPDGLIVPVLKDVNRKGLRQVAQEAHELIARSREGKGRGDDFDGGTFTVSNLGMYGVDQFTAIINPPESAILAVGAIAEKPVAVDGQVALRHRMRLTLSSDHRVIYGATAAQFLAELRRVLEHPVLLAL
ncbi:MAG TPA: dihydrolipoamide acetyltransferase family protein, partial [Chloroflexota bacterium]|nr:dihydrolipoamide acetyltransferase family protein [Chloroflexota bacterium]